MTQINLSAGNPTLAQIKTISSKKDFVNIPARSLAKSDFKALSVMFPLVFGRDLKEDDQVITVQFENGRFKRSYPLSVSQDENGALVSRVGKELLPINLNGGADVTIAGVTLDKYEDPCLVFFIEDENEEMVELPLPLKFTREAGESLREDGEYNYRKLAKMTSKPEKLAELLRVAKEFSGSSGNSTMVDMADLPEYTPIKIDSSREINASYGKSYILKVVHPETEELVEIWAPYSIKEWLGLGATIGEETFFQFYSYQNKKGKTSYNADIDGLVWATDENSANIDMALFL